MDSQQPLRDDVRQLGELLGETLRARAGVEIFNAVERVRALSKGARTGDLQALAEVLRDLPVGAAEPVARAFSHFLSLANIAEQHHRVRRRRAYQLDPSSRPQPGSFEDTFESLLTRGVDPETLHARAASLQIELVLTAHPTAITRRTLVAKQLRIADALAKQDRPDLTAVEREEIAAALRREILATWETDEIRARRPTPLDEAIAGLLVFEQTVWDAVPRYLRSLDRALVAATGKRLPLDAAPIRFGSWMGGDRDGNPRVTPAVTREACLVARWMAAGLYERAVDALRFELSVSEASDELRDRVPDAREPYRVFLGTLRAKLRDTRAALARQLEGAAPSPLPIASAADVLEPLRLCCRSLVETGQSLLAEGALADLIRRAAVFGVTLVRLDIRQHARQHAAALDAITEALGKGRYSEWDEARRQAFLTGSLRNAQPVLPAALADNTPEDVREVLDTFRVAATVHPESLGAYVISMAQAPSDVLAIEFLQAQHGLHLRSVPLFEQVDTLGGAASTVRDLLAIPEYRDRIDNRLEVMVGYSDSAKDGGRLAANWALYRAQEAIVDACRSAGVELTLFHGRGGSISRGGGPTYVAIQSQPPGSIDGRLRVTEQGEMIQAQFGLPEIAARTLEVYTTATLDATLAPAATPPRDWRDAMDCLATTARNTYRKVVYDDPRFVPYFRRATPEIELGDVPIGSRPARRPSKDAGVESLRAIPWVFAWTQTRLLLPSWLGAGEALNEALSRGERELLRKMYREWPFFRSTLDLIETALAETEPRIAAEYDRQLVPADLRPVGDDLRRRLEMTKAALLDATGSEQLLEDNPVLRRSIEVRNPYVDPINLVQIELLRRLRSSPEPDPHITRAFMVTVNGIAAGMRNTG